MPMPNAGGQFLHEKYPGLSNSREVNHEKKRREKAGRPAVNEPADKIASWLEIVQKTHMGHGANPEVLERIKRSYHKKYVIKPEEIPDAYFESIKRKHRDEGRGYIEIPPDYRQDLAGAIIKDQENSLDNWVDYLASSDAKYPIWLKYLAFRNIVRMGRFDKKKKEFTKRYGKTVSPFPELNREALAIVMDAVERKVKGEPLKFGYDIQAETKARFEKLLGKVNFPKLYAIAIEEFKPIDEKLLKITEGKWVTYPRGSDPKPLVASISNHGTGWCLRGQAMAERYLRRDKNELHVFYSNNEKNEPVVPRVVMVVNQNNQLAEVHGVAFEENLDQYIGDVVKEKLKEFPDGQEYEKKTEDMKRLTQIEEAVKTGQELNKEDLIFLYEIDAPIQGFGYQRDPRIAELMKQRDPKKDAPIVFDCRPDQIAHNKDEIKKDTKAYVGELCPDIFNDLPKTLEHIYTSFPEGKIVQKEITIGGKTAKELAKELKEKGNKIEEYTEKELLGNKEFKPLKKAEKLDLVILSVKGLGFPNGATTQQIYDKAKKLGLELAPQEVGPQLRLQYEDQPLDEWQLIGSEPFTASSGDLIVSRVLRNDYGRWLYYDSDGGPGGRWDSTGRWVFARK